MIWNNEPSWKINSLAYFKTKNRMIIDAYLNIHSVIKTYATLCGGFEIGATKMKVQIETFNWFTYHQQYCQTSNISCSSVGNKLADHSDVVGACWHYSNYSFILAFTPGFNGLGKDNNCKMRQETFKFGWDFLRVFY